MRDDAPTYPAVSPIWAGIVGRCPCCGKGRLFNGFLTVAPACDNCGLDFSFVDSGDGPAVFVMLVAGFIVVGAALAVEVLYHPPLWIHAALWLPIGFAVPLLLLRPFKGVLITLQYHNRAAEGRRVSDPS
jgi:uncharacterized protein (DUF983 family)